jgi:uncharacterized protein YutE (UPF0331/DUF86 family)
MTNIDKVVVASRLALITRYLERLKGFENTLIEEYLSDFDRQLIVERLLQLMIQAAIDINDHILSKLNPGASMTNFEAFIELSKFKILTQNLAENLAKSASMRNRLVHEYDDIDSIKVFQGITFALRQYPMYVQQIHAYLISINTSTS